jgi:hypothetical protein
MALTGNPIGIEKPKPTSNAEASDNPEANHDCYLSPAHQLEMVLKWSHSKNSLASGNLEVESLDNY